MKIGLYRPSVSESASRHIRNILDSAGITTDTVYAKFEDSFDCVIVMGGDRGVRDYFHHNVDASIPVLGVGEGESTGSLSQVDYRQFGSYVHVLKKGDHAIGEFPRLGVRIDASKTPYPVLNDVAVFPSKSAMLMEHTLRVGGDEVWHDNSDGVIISTPIGSSAYSMSAGGPVLFQDAPVFGIISVNSLDVTRRPIIVPDTAMIEVDEVSSRLHCEAVLDGIERKKVKSRLECTQFLPPARIVRLQDSSATITAMTKKVHLAEDLLSMPPSSKLLLKTLEYEGTLTHKEIAAKTLLPDRTVRLALSNLIKRGYVKRKVSSRDARQRIYEISDKFSGSYADDV